MNAQPCPCGQDGKTSFAQCCGRWKEAGNAPAPESLMRSRYSAFVRGDSAYLLATWHPDTRPAKLDLAEPPVPRWLGLEIRSAPLPQGDAGEVEFVARYKVYGRACRLHECSRFVRLDGRWFYVDGLIIS